MMFSFLAYCCGVLAWKQNERFLAVASFGLSALWLAIFLMEQFA